MSIELSIKKKYNLPKSFFGKFPIRKWDEMISDINSDVDYGHINKEIANFLVQLKPIFDGSKAYSVDIYKTASRPTQNAERLFTFNIEVYMGKRRIIELEYFPMRSDGLPSEFKYYEIWIDSSLINKNLLIKNLYHFNDDYKIEFANHIFFNSGYVVDEVTKRIVVNVTTRIKADGKTRDIYKLPYDFETLCRDVINDPKKVAHALYFKNNEVSYDDFVANEKDSHSVVSMINI